MIRTKYSSNSFKKSISIKRAPIYHWHLSPFYFNTCVEGHNSPWFFIQLIFFKHEPNHNHPTRRWHKWGLKFHEIQNFESKKLQLVESGYICIIITSPIDQTLKKTCSPINLSLLTTKEFKFHINFYLLIKSYESVFNKFHIYTRIRRTILETYGNRDISS